MPVPIIYISYGVKTSDACGVGVSVAAGALTTVAAVSTHELPYALVPAKVVSRRLC
jgi:hypothetical protein